MKFAIFSAAFCTALLAGTAMSFAQNVDDGVSCRGPCNFPLAAWEEGVDSQAIKQALPGAVNTGPYDMTKWKYGHAFDAPNGTPIWNPVKVENAAWPAARSMRPVTIAGTDTPARLLRRRPIPAWISSGPRCSTPPAHG